MTSSSASELQIPQARLVSAMQQLGAAHGDLADILANLMSVIAEEALQNGFATRLNAALLVDGVIKTAGVPHPMPTASHVLGASKEAPASSRPAPRGRRTPGPWDPYAVYAEAGEAGLKGQLSQLELEQLRGIVAEHGMNSDGLPLRWKKADRVAGRIVERVVGQASKGDAFRRG